MILIPAAAEFPIDLHYGPPRTPGVHLSDILRSLGFKLGLLKETDDDELNDLNYLSRHVLPTEVHQCGPLMRCVIGYMWEEWYFHHVLKRAIFHPGEFTLDGIIGTPDGIEEDSRYLTLHETKATFKSSRHPMESHKLYLYQIACYLKMVALRFNVPISQCRAVLHPLFIKGNYRGIDPISNPTAIYFTQEEVDGIWAAVVEHGIQMKQDQRELEGIHIYG